MRFSELHAEQHKTQIFHRDSLAAWVDDEFGPGHASLVNVIINIDGVDPLGDSFYKTPYEI